MQCCGVLGARSVQRDCLALNSSFAASCQWDVRFLTCYSGVNNSSCLIGLLWALNQFITTKHFRTLAGNVCFQNAVIVAVLSFEVIVFISSPRRRNSHDINRCSSEGNPIFSNLLLILGRHVTKRFYYTLLLENYLDLPCFSWNLVSPIFKNCWKCVLKLSFVRVRSAFCYRDCGIPATKCLIVHRNA